MCSSVQQIFSDTNQFWSTYKSKPRSFYGAFAEGYGRILAGYKGYTDYPFSIPIENNHAVPDGIKPERSAQITIWSQRHISIAMVGHDTGFGVLYGVVEGQGWSTEMRSLHGRKSL